MTERPPREHRRDGEEIVSHHVRAHDDDDHDFHAELVGQKLRAKGYRAIDLTLILLVIGIFGSAAFIYHDQKETRRQEMLRITSEHEHLRQDVQALRTSTDEQTYVLTLNQQRREELRLDMPDSLKRKTWKNFYENEERRAK